MLEDSSSKGMFVLVDLAVRAESTRASIDGSVPIGFLDVSLAGPVDFFQGADGVDREGVWADANNGSLRIEVRVNWFVGTLEDEQTIFLMFFPRLDVSVTASGLDHNGPARNLAQKWAGVFCERMEGEAVDGNECNLDSSSALEHCFIFLPKIRADRSYSQH